MDSGVTVPKPPAKRAPAPQFLALPRLERALAHVQKGMPIAAACGLEKVARDTWGEYRRMARPVRSKKTPTVPERRLLTWDEAAGLATDAAEGWLYKWFLREAAKPRGKGNWLPPLKVLALRFSERWAEKRVVTDERDTEPSEYDLERLTREELKTLQEIVRKAKEDGGDGRRLRAV